MTKKFFQLTTLQALYDYVQVSMNMSLSGFFIVTNYPKVVYDSYAKSTPLLGFRIPNFTVFFVVLR